MVKALQIIIIEINLIRNDTCIPFYGTKVKSFCKHEGVGV